MFANLGISIKEMGATAFIVGRELNNILKDSWQDVAIYWHKELRPKHFTKAGAKEYGYTPRSGEGSSGKLYALRYTGKKWRKWRHTYPMVWSGESLAATRQLKVAATHKGSRCVMRAPRLNFRNKYSKINLRDELTRISPREIPELLGVFKRSFWNNVKMLRARYQYTWAA